ncbi:MBL fold metallo-hydrolase [Paractinoplanes lichenicola]|uniref:MBL fold metallo-hydrolase n=1 Tax=Paractinoplanes lichenicola TaxID=2802976 RepID=A0ABS1VMT2_9ACTN|nr:MBL fold metallo-hydrolase [Actinoplanes lichenicola]MBL7255965.1 MBL fold metallo-hydrolase [Actinoplanes lichenicola]
MIVTGTAQQQAWQRRELPPVEQVRDDVWSVPVPIPHNPLRYTLSYAFVNDGGILLVDPGWDTPEGRAALEAGLNRAGATVSDITGVVVTHVHPDHHGLSGWLREQSGAWIGMHPVEAQTLPVRVWRDRQPSDDRGWLIRHGVPDDEASAMTVDPEQLRGVFAMAEPDRAIEDGDLLPAAGHELRAVWTPGHTPGHLCLHDPGDGILLTGDHLLPRISPNIGVHSGNDGDPLTAYLASLEQTAKFASDEALPAHEYRFRGVGERAAELIHHHEERSREILSAIDPRTGSTAWAIAAALTWSRGWPALHGMMRRMALAETVAHLQHLDALGSVRPFGAVSVRWQLTEIGLNAAVRESERLPQRPS